MVCMVRILVLRFLVALAVVFATRVCEYEYSVCGGGVPFAGVGGRCRVESSAIISNQQ